MSDSESDEINFIDDDDEDDFDISDDDDEEDIGKKKRKNSKTKVTNVKKNKNEKIKASPQKKKAKSEEASSVGMKPKKLSANQDTMPTAINNGAPSQKNLTTNMKGPPASTPLEARNLVKDYMLQQNRPYSAIQIHDNLHGRVAKPQLQRALDELSAPGPKCCLRVKDYGKAKIYFSDQSLLPSPDASTMRVIQDEISTLTETFREKQETEAQLRSESSRLLSEPSDSLIDSELQALEAEVVDKTARLNRLLELSSSSAATTGRVGDLGKERSVAVETFNFYRNSWKTRKEKVVDIVDMICEGGLGKNRKDTMNILGIETDEDEGVTLPKPLTLT